MAEEEGSSGTGTVLLDQVANWLMSQALGDVNVEEIFEGCCARLNGAGIPLWRAIVHFRTLHPLFASVSLIWRPGEGADTEQHLHGEAFTSQEWQQSPFHHMLKTQVPFLRRRLRGESARLDFDILKEFRDQGATDYLAYAVPFATDDDKRPQHNGIIGSWATDRPSGFTDADIKALIRIQRRMVVSCKVQIKDQISKNVLSTYLGMDAGQQVLNGQIKRGDGETIHAVIWYSDMRDSTRLADTLTGEAFFSVLNTYFECTASAVLAHGGEVLRFVGDAVLAIFPIRSEGEDEYTACNAAIEAAQDAQRRMDDVNRKRSTEGLEPLDFGLGLHVGDVMYGNIGVPERLEFSVIGPAANEVVRLEGLTKKLGRRVLVSENFARYISSGLESLGKHELTGVGERIEVFAQGSCFRRLPANVA